MMTPYYDHAGIQIFLGDCREILPTFAPNSIDLVLTDPPYGTASESKVQKRGNVLMPFNILWDHTLPLDWMKIAGMLLKNGASATVFTDKLSVKTVWDYLEASGIHGLQTIYWRKTNPPPQPRQNFCSAIETIVFGRKSGKINYWAGGGTTHNVFDSPIVGGEDRTEHPTQKPLDLICWLMSILCPPNGLALDPFLGSGTTLVAAKMLGRRGIGIELEEKYCAIAAQRLEQEVLTIPISLPTERPTQLSLVGDA